MKNKTNHSRNDVLGSSSMQWHYRKSQMSTHQVWPSNSIGTDADSYEDGQPHKREAAFACKKEVHPRTAWCTQFWAMNGHLYWLNLYFYIYILLFSLPLHDTSLASEVLGNNKPTHCLKVLQSLAQCQETSPHPSPKLAKEQSQWQPQILANHQFQLEFWTLDFSRAILTNCKKGLPVNIGSFLAIKQQGCHFTSRQETRIILRQRKAFQLVSKRCHFHTSVGKKTQNSYGLLQIKQVLDKPKQIKGCRLARKF